MKTIMLKTMNKVMTTTSNEIMILRMETHVILD